MRVGRVGHGGRLGRAVRQVGAVRLKGGTRYLGRVPRHRGYTKGSDFGGVILVISVCSGRRGPTRLGDRDGPDRTVGDRVAFGGSLAWRGVVNRRACLVGHVASHDRGRDAGETGPVAGHTPVAIRRHEPGHGIDRVGPGVVNRLGLAGWVVSGAGVIDRVS